MGLFEKIFGTHSEKELKKINPIVDAIEALDEKMQALSDEELRGKTQEFKDRLAAGETLDDILVEAFAVVREAAYRVLGMKHYRVQLIGGIVGFNVFVVLIVGIVSGSIIMLATGQTAAVDLLTNMGSGAAGMFETSMVAVLVAAMCSLIREYGGFEALLSAIKKVFKGDKGGQLGIGLLVGAMDIATANNLSLIHI